MSQCARFESGSASEPNRTNRIARLKQNPVLPFLVFLKFLVFFFPLRGIPCFFFWAFFPSFSRDFRGSVGIKNPCFFGGFPCLFPKKQGKEGQGNLGNPKGGLAKGGLARKAPIGPKRALSGQFLLSPHGRGVRRNWSRSAPKRAR